MTKREDDVCFQEIAKALSGKIPAPVTKEGKKRLDKDKDRTLRLLLRSVYLRGQVDGHMKTSDLSWEDLIVYEIERITELGGKGPGREELIMKLDELDHEGDIILTRSAEIVADAILEKGGERT